MYIYILINPIDNSVFYVGASDNPHTRFITHIAESKIYENAKSKKIKEIMELGYKIEMEVVEECQYYFACFWEQVYMDLFRSWGFTLLQKNKSYYPIFTALRHELNSVFNQGIKKDKSFDAIVELSDKVRYGEPISYDSDIDYLVYE